MVPRSPVPERLAREALLLEKLYVPPAGVPTAVITLVLPAPQILISAGVSVTVQEAQCCTGLAAGVPAPGPAVGGVAGLPSLKLAVRFAGAPPHDPARSSLLFQVYGRAPPDR